MKKMFKRTAAIAISAFMAAQYIPFTTMAEGSNSLTIHPYVVTQAQYDSAKEAANNYTLNGVATHDSTYVPSGLSEEAMTFDIIQINADGSTFSGGFTASNTKTATNMPNGYYKITPHEKVDTDVNFRGAEAIYIQIPTSATSDVHIYPKYTNNSDNGNDINGGNTSPDDPSNSLHSIKLIKSLSDNPSSYNWTATNAGAEFDAYYKNGLGQWEKANTSGKYVTNNQGIVIIDGLALGEYALVETKAPAGYLLDQTPVMFNLTGSTSGANASVQTKTLKNDKKLTVSKAIKKDGAGDTYNWTITADLPDNRANLISYVITDKFKGIDITGITIDGLDGTGATPDFTAAVSLTNADEYIITITDSGLAKIKDSTNTNFNDVTALNITVASTLDTNDLNASGNAVNKASISYKYAYNPDPTDPSTPDIPEITDPDVDPTYPTPNNYPDALPDDPVPSNTDPDSPTSADSIKPGTFTISNHGSPELGGASYEVRKADGTSVVVSVQDNADDAAVNPKLAVVSNLAPGHYKVYQTGVDSGHVLNTTPIDIYVGKDGNIYNNSDYAAAHQIINTGVDPNVPNQIVFVNDTVTAGFNLPFTGTTATIVFSITGILLMAGTAFFIFIILKKRDDDEEEQENN